MKLILLLVYQSNYNTYEIHQIRLTCKFILKFDIPEKA